MKYEHKIYRCEWLLVIQTVDQYNSDTNEREIVGCFPTREMAVEKIPEFGYQHEFLKDRWIPHNKKHDYQIMKIVYHERLVPYISPP